MSEVAEALPTADEATAGAAVDPATQALTEKNRAIDADDGENKEAPTEAKPEKTPEQREIERLRRGIDRKNRQREEARAEARMLREQLGLTRQPIGDTNGSSADDSQPLSLTRAELAQLVKAEALKLAPTVAEQRTEVQRRQGVIESLAKTWGQQKFDEVASDLDEVFGGLQDASGNPKPAIEAVFEADDPVRVIEWLADPENADEAERISKLSAIRAGREIAKLELRLKSEADRLKPRVSKAPAPLEPVKGAGPVSKSLADLPFDQFVKRRQEMIRNR